MTRKSLMRLLRRAADIAWWRYCEAESDGMDFPSLERIASESIWLGDCHGAMRRGKGFSDVAIPRASFILKYWDERYCRATKARRIRTLR